MLRIRQKEISIAKKAMIFELYSFLILLSCVGAGAQSLVREENTTIQLPAEMPVSGFDLVSAFGGLRFDEPVSLATAPGDTGRVFVVERKGRIMVVDISGPVPSAKVFIDMRSEVRSSWIECGLLEYTLPMMWKREGLFR